MALACLVAGDRHHHLAAEILPALHAGKVVICDRYLPSSLVLQGIDGIESDTVWRLNAGVYVPDVTVLLNADHHVIADRLRQRGTHSRFRTPAWRQPRRVRPLPSRRHRSTHRRLASDDSGLHHPAS
jgi:dTMP kinase